MEKNPMFNIFVKKSGQSLNVDFDKYPEHVKTHLIEYGLKQKFNDVHSAEENGETAWGLVQNLHERLLAGEIAKRATGNPIETRLKVILRKLVAGKTAEVNKLSVDDLVKAIAEQHKKPSEAIKTHFTKIATAQIEKERIENQSLMSDIKDI